MKIISEGTYCITPEEITPEMIKIDQNTYVLGDDVFKVVDGPISGNTTGVKLNPNAKSGVTKPSSSTKSGVTQAGQSEKTDVSQSNQGVKNNEPQQQQSTKVQYMVLHVRPEDAASKINSLAANGWRVVSSSESKWVIRRCFGFSNTVDSIMNIILVKE